MIVFQCPNCPTKLRVDPALAGRAVLCPKCRGHALAPAAPPAVAPAPSLAPSPPAAPSLPPSLPVQLVPAEEEVITDLVPVEEEVPYLEPVTEEEEVIDLPVVEGEDVLDAQPVGGSPRKAKKKPKRPRHRGTSPAVHWRVRYGLEEDPDNPDRGTYFWSPARIGGLVSIGVSLGLLVVWYVLRERWDDQMTVAREAILWVLFGGIFGGGLLVNILVSVLVFVPLFLFSAVWDTVLTWFPKIFVWVLMGGAIAGLIGGVYFFVRGHD